MHPSSLTKVSLIRPSKETPALLKVVKRNFYLCIKYAFVLYRNVIIFLNGMPYNWAKHMLMIRSVQNLSLCPERVFIFILHDIFLKCNEVL